MMQGPLFKCAHREQGLGYCSVALHRAFIWRQRVHERAPRTGRLSAKGFVSGVVAGAILMCSLARSQLLQSTRMFCLGRKSGYEKRAATGVVDAVVD